MTEHAHLAETRAEALDAAMRMTSQAEALLAEIDKADPGDYTGGIDGPGGALGHLSDRIHTRLSVAREYATIAAATWAPGR